MRQVALQEPIRLFVVRGLQVVLPQEPIQLLEDEETVVLPQEPTRHFVAKRARIAEPAQALPQTHVHLGEPIAVRVRVPLTKEVVLPTKEVVLRKPTAEIEVVAHTGERVPEELSGERLRHVVTVIVGHIEEIAIEELIEDPLTVDAIDEPIDVPHISSGGDITDVRDIADSDVERIVEECETIGEETIEDETTTTDVCVGGGLLNAVFIVASLEGNAIGTTDVETTTTDVTDAIAIDTSDGLTVGELIAEEPTDVPHIVAVRIAAELTEDLLIGGVTATDVAVKTILPVLPITSIDHYA